jgi:NADP-dependent 3-hydroxy acid dehydrogenase YdfG
VKLRDETVVITGATSGVGRASARAFAHRGARIGLLARGDDALRATRQELEEIGSSAIELSADVADADAARPRNPGKQRAIARKRDLLNILVRLTLRAFSQVGVIRRILLPR